MAKSNKPAKKPGSSKQGGKAPAAPAAPPIGVHWALNRDGTQVVLSLVQDGRPLAQASLTPERTSALIGGLGQLRRQMTPDQHRAPFSEGEKVDAVFDPPWYVYPEPFPDGSGIAVRHPGYGVLGFIFSKASIEKIVGLLARHREKAPA